MAIASLTPRSTGKVANSRAVSIEDPQGVGGHGSDRLQTRPRTRGRTRAEGGESSAVSGRSGGAVTFSRRPRREPRNRGHQPVAHHGEVAEASPLEPPQPFPAGISSSDRARSKALLHRRSLYNGGTVAARSPAHAGRRLSGERSSWARRLARSVLGGWIDDDEAVPEQQRQRRMHRPNPAGPLGQFADCNPIRRKKAHKVRPHRHRSQPERLAWVSDHAAHRRPVRRSPLSRRTRR